LEGAREKENQKTAKGRFFGSLSLLRASAGQSRIEIMKIGYPCLNLSLACRSSRTFRLASFSQKRFLDTAANNLDCLLEILKFNLKNNLLFFRISSDLIPFASHPVSQKINWPKIFQRQFKTIGDFIRKNKMRISMHPDPFVVLNSPDKKVVSRSRAELFYHAQVMNLLGLQASHKIQIHLGGLYGHKKRSMERFIQRYKKLPAIIKKYLVLENDARLFSLKDCLEVAKLTGLPVLFDVFHHSIFNNGQEVRQAVKLAAKTWQSKDGPLMIDYSSQAKGERLGSHAQTISLQDFKKFLKQIAGLQVDIILEIKDKEKSALKARKILDIMFQQK